MTEKEVLKLKYIKKEAKKITEILFFSEFIKCFDESVQFFLKEYDEKSLGWPEKDWF